MQPSPSIPPTTYHRRHVPTSLGMGPDQGRGSASTPLNTSPSGIKPHPSDPC